MQMGSRFKQSLRAEVNANKTDPVKRVYNAIAIDEHGQAANGLDVIPPFVSVNSTMILKRAKPLPLGRDMAGRKFVYVSK